MNISIITAFPALYDSFLNTSLIGRAVKNSHINPHLINFFDGLEQHERIDAPSFGHDAGMLIRPEVVEKQLQRQEDLYGKSIRIFFSPHGKRLTQPLLKKIYEQLEKSKHLSLVVGRYEGMDARIEEVYADHLISLGDFVLMGGDLPAMMFLEGLIRYIPGAVGKAQSVEQDSFSGAFVDYPSYSPPVVWKNKEVPQVLRSGNHKLIKEWQHHQAVQRTVFDHFEWLKTHAYSKTDRVIAAEHIPSHYVVLMHDQVRLPHDMVGTTSVTSFDIHDVARTCRTFGIKNYFLVTPLEDQQRIVKTLLSFWQEGGGIDYNKKRHEAVNAVRLSSSLDEVCATIAHQEGELPVLIGTSARTFNHIPVLSYFDQSQAWASRRPVLIILGTAQGLSDAIIQRCDYLLGPIAGFSDFNHLSVRAATAIILDRWLGINLRPL